MLPEYQNIIRIPNLPCTRTFSGYISLIQFLTTFQKSHTQTVSILQKSCPVPYNFITVCIVPYKKTDMLCHGLVCYSRRPLYIYMCVYCLFVSLLNLFCVNLYFKMRRTHSWWTDMKSTDSMFSYLNVMDVT